MFDTNRRKDLDRCLTKLNKFIETGMIRTIYKVSDRPHGDREGCRCEEDKTYNIALVIAEEVSQPILLKGQTFENLKETVKIIEAFRDANAIADLYYADFQTTDWSPEKEMGAPAAQVVPRTTEKEITQEGRLYGKVEGPHEFELPYKYSDVPWKLYEFQIEFRVFQDIVPQGA